MDALQWGLIPTGSKTRRSLIEPSTPELQPVDKAPSFRKAFAKRRCLIPADGFYEWRKTAKPKLPFALRHERRTPLHLCRALGKLEDLESREWLRTCTIITGEPARTCRLGAGVY